jgi:hypothetical protein
VGTALPTLDVEEIKKECALECAASIVVSQVNGMMEIEEREAIILS